MLSLAVWLAGLQAVKRQRLRLRQLSQCVELIQTVAVEIRYGNIPIRSILRSASLNEAFDTLKFLKGREESASDFSADWQRRVEGDPTLSLKREEKAILIRFGRSLGTTDTENQLILCERFRAQLNQCLESAAARQTENKRLLLGGTAAAAMLLFALIL